ncbi:unnamed protein product [Menidia menidia]|uniref:(Atlantic silverside) hypothetical protein n=1 Tax=Menidia menidia TaxID=238744 RepID=A0A8S4ASE8_9TELE|nr:unnamed protein product [Menidia menidia]
MSHRCLRLPVGRPVGRQAAARPHLAALQRRRRREPAVAWQQRQQGHRLPLSPWESRIVERLMTPTLSFLNRSRSAATLLGGGRPSASGPRKRPPSPAAPRRRPLSPLVPAAASRTPAGGKMPPAPTGTRTRPKRAQTPARVQPQAVAPVAVETGPEPDRAEAPQERREPEPGPVPAIVVSAAPLTPPSISPAPSGEPAGPAPAAPAAPVVPAAPAVPAAAAYKPSAGTTDPEEAARVLAERRRQAREQREKEEQDRLEQEHRNRLVPTRKSRTTNRAGEAGESEPDRARFMAEQQRLRDEAQRAEEEQRTRAEEEDNARLQKQRDEAEAKAREEAERQRLEREKHFQKEEQERLERKKRLEEIMKRTRKSDASEKVSWTKSLGGPWSLGALGGPWGLMLVLLHRRTSERLHRSTAPSSARVSSAPGNLQAAAPLVVNGVQPSSHQNGALEGRGQQGGRGGEPRLPFEGAEPFLMKSSPMKPQHVAGGPDGSEPEPLMMMMLPIFILLQYPSDGLKQADPPSKRVT